MQTYPECDRTCEQRTHKPDCGSQAQHHCQSGADCRYGPGDTTRSHCSRQFVKGAITRAFQGKVIEVGNHQELVEKGGRYAELWEHQQQEEKQEEIEKL